MTDSGVFGTLQQSFRTCVSRLLLKYLQSSSTFRSQSKPSALLLSCYLERQGHGKYHCLVGHDNNQSSVLQSGVLYIRTIRNKAKQTTQHLSCSLKSIENKARSYQTACHLEKIPRAGLWVSSWRGVSTGNAKEQALLPPGPKESLRPTLGQHASKDTILISLLPLAQVSNGNDPHIAVTDVMLPFKSKTAGNYLRYQHFISAWDWLVVHSFVILTTNFQTQKCMCPSPFCFSITAAKLYTQHIWKQE